MLATQSLLKNETSDGFSVLRTVQKVPCDAGVCAPCALLSKRIALFLRHQGKAWVVYITHM